MLNYDGPRTEEEMRARARELHRQTFPDRSGEKLANRLAEIKRAAEEARRLARESAIALDERLATEAAKSEAREERRRQLREAGARATKARSDEAKRSLPAPHSVALQLSVRPTLKAILQAVSAAFNVAEIEIISARRTQGVVFARHAFCRIARDLTFSSFPTIGRRIGGRDHTTIMHGVWKTQQLFPSLVLNPQTSVTDCARLFAALYGIGELTDEIQALLAASTRSPLREDSPLAEAPQAQ